MPITRATRSTISRKRTRTSITDSDKKAPGYTDANEAKKAIDRADKALGRYVDMLDKK